MEAGVHFSLFIVLENEMGTMCIYFLPRDLQTEEMFVPRKPLSETAKRAGWQGFSIQISKALSEPVRYADGGVIEFGSNKKRKSEK